MSSIHNRLPRDFAEGDGDQSGRGARGGKKRPADKSATRVVLSVTDRQRHCHIYIGCLRDSFKIARQIHRHTAEGQLAFDAAIKLHRQLARACDSVG